MDDKKLFLSTGLALSYAERVIPMKVLAMMQPSDQRRVPQSLPPQKSRQAR